MDDEGRIFWQNLPWKWTTGEENLGRASPSQNLRFGKKDLAEVAGFWPLWTGLDSSQETDCALLFGVLSRRSGRKPSKGAGEEGKRELKLGAEAAFIAGKRAGLARETIAREIGNGGGGGGGRER